MKYHLRLNNRQHQKGLKSNVFSSERGAIDLASVMVGIIVIGLIGALISATVFVVIPWAQDNAAKQQLDSIASAENAYMGLSSATPSPLPAGYVTNSFGSSSQLAAGNLLATGESYCAVIPIGGNSYSGYAKSASGKVWSITDNNSKPVISDVTPAECGFTNTDIAPYVDPTPTLTTLTYKCDTTRTATLPWKTELTGVETWDDGSPPVTYNNAVNSSSKTLTAGITYKVTLDGTYKAFWNVSSLTACLISMDHWGKNTGVTDATYAFLAATKLTAVPAHIPSTITNMGSMFQSAAVFNQDISGWDVSNVTNMSSMFSDADSFDQPLNDWNVGNVTNFSRMFVNSDIFDQPLDKWNTSKATDMGFMFADSKKFNKNIKTWDVSNVTESTWFRAGSVLTAENSPF